MSFMFAISPELSCGPGTTYGWLRRFRQIAVSCVVLLVAAATPALAQQITPQHPIHIVALGDSLTAGLGLPLKSSFVQRLQTALAARDSDVEITNAGVSGDTASDGLARLDWSVPDGTDAVIVELGANDMLRGFKPELTRAALDAILQRLTARHIAVLLCGMRAAPNLGADYVSSFEAIYPALAAKYGTLLYPFFLDGAAGNLSLLQGDGMHPNAAGVDVIVQRILPKVEELIAQFHGQRPS
jgi:acyl-CoA thioesterase I